MSYRNLVSYLTLPTVIVLATLGNSCATNNGELGEERGPRAVQAPASRLAANEGTAAATAKKADPTAKAAKPQVLPSPPKLTAIAAPADTAAAPPRLKRAAKPAKTEHAVAAPNGSSKVLQEARVTRSVAAQVLNVRAKPSTEAPIVGRLTRGSQLPVEIKGEWAKVGDNQFVQTKFLNQAVVSSK